MRVRRDSVSPSARRSFPEYAPACFVTLLLFLFTTVIGGGGWLPSARAADGRPNVLFIAIDDLNDWVGVLNGHPQARTPNIDQLAGRGTLFTNAHVQAPVCTPSRASMMTGKYPSTTGLYFLRPLMANAPDSVKKSATMAKRFARAGYRTMGVGKVYGGREARYFQRYGGRNGGFGPRPKNKISYPKGHPLWDWGAYPDADRKMPDHKIASWAIDRLRESREKPFFLAVGFYRPHVPMYVPQKWFDLHSPLSSIQLPDVLDEDRDDLSAYVKALTNPRPAPLHKWLVEHNEWKHAVQAYLASSTFVDHQVGRVLDALEESGHMEDTLVVLFSDHGFHLGEKQRWAKRTLWQTSTRVPLIVAKPGQEEGQRTAKPVGLIDLYPTLLELCGLEMNQSLEGRSLTPLLEDPDAEWNRPVRITFGPGNHAIRSERWRYIRYNDGSEELYDHRNDPDEWHNLAGQEKYSEVINRLKKYLPENEHEVLEGNSTGHKHYRDAENLSK